MKEVSSKIRENKLWQEIFRLAEFAYTKIDEINTSYPNEIYATASKLRHAANDCLFYTSQAVGCDLADFNMHDWNSARKNLFSLQSMYTFGAKQGLFELEPEMIVMMDDLLDNIDKKIAESKRAIKKREKEELEPWLKKYNIWQKMQD